MEDGVVIALNRLNRILRLDPEERMAVVEPGVINLDVSKAAAPYGLYYAPDPSSQPICTIGGNLAFNSGGAHCLKYGMTSNHVLAHQSCAARWRSGPVGWRKPGRGRPRPGRSVRRLRRSVRCRAGDHPAPDAAARSCTARCWLPITAWKPPVKAWPGWWLPACCRERSRSWTTWRSRPPKPPCMPEYPAGASAIADR